MHAPAVCSRIKFQNAFVLYGIPNSLPSGSYSIETRDSYYWTFPFSWKKKTKTTIRVNVRSGLVGRMYDYEVDPRDIFAALEKDKLSIVN